ncbi:MAG: hypothetical protein ISF22_06095 [Methanomassiliicoccus sp.]|nr:hypothetical protein [Methanomassiliicoccus sp.]
MTETSIQTASVRDGALSWNSDGALTYAVGKQRAKLLLGADLLSAYADLALSLAEEGLRTARRGWERGRAPGIDGAKSGGSDAAREITRIDRELDAIERFDRDKYLYEVARAVLMESTEFGQMTNILKRHIYERASGGRVEKLLDNWRPSGLDGRAEVEWACLRISPTMADLPEAVWRSRNGPLPRDPFLEKRIVPLTWLIDLLMGTAALEVEMGTSELKAARALKGWEEGMDGRMKEIHRNIVRRACCIRSVIDAVELEPIKGKNNVQLKLRGDFILSFLPSFSDYRALAARFDRARDLDLAALVVVGMGGSGKTTFLRRCYDLLRDDPDNRSLNEDIDPKSTAFVVGHIFRDITIPLFGGRKKLTLCWMDTAGSENYRLLGQQLTVSVRELKRKTFIDRPVDYNLLFVWSYGPGYDASRDPQAFEDVLSRFLDEVEDLAYFDLERPNKVFLLLNKSDIAARDGTTERFSVEHERRFRAVLERHEGLSGESLGFASTLNDDSKEISDRFLASVFGLSDRDWKNAFVTVRAGINQGIIAGLLPPEEAGRFKREVYDLNADGGQEAYFRATVNWIDRYLSSGSNAEPSARALLRSLRTFLSGEMEGDAVA